MSKCFRGLNLTHSNDATHRSLVGQSLKDQQTTCAQQLHPCYFGMRDRTPNENGDCPTTDLLVNRLGKALCLFFGAFAFCSAFSIAAAQIAFGLSLIPFLALVFIERRQKCSVQLKSVYVSVALFVAWLFVAAAFSDSPMQSMLAIKEQWLFLIIPVGCYIAQDRQRMQQVVIALGAGLLLASCYGLVQHFTGESWYRARGLYVLGPGSYRLQGFFSHTLTYGNYLAVSIVFLLSYTYLSFGKLAGWKRTLLISSLTLGLVALALTNGRGPALAALAGLIATGFALRRMKYTLAGLALLIVLAAPGMIKRSENLNTIDATLVFGGDRLIIWKNSFRMVGEHPLTGTGPGQFSTSYRQLVPDRIGSMPHSHNDLINMAAVAGLPGMIFFISIWAAVFLNLWRGVRNSSRSQYGFILPMATILASVTFLVSGLPEATFADEEVRQLLMLIWGIGLSGRFSTT